MSRDLQSVLGRHVASDPDPERALRECRKAWREHGILCIRLDQVKNVGKRWQLEAIAIETYGKMGK